MLSIPRRKFLKSGVGLGLSACVGAAALPAFAQEGEEAPPANRDRTEGAFEMITPDTQRAANRGMEWLAKKQLQSGRMKGAFGVSGYPGGVAVSSLSGLAFMCGGSPPGQGPYGRHVDRCVDFVMSCVQSTGFITAPGGMDQMYGHGFATLFLSQAYGMSMRPEIEEKLKSAVKLIVETQNDAGGWRYAPQKSDADLSITICQIMALRAARDAGINVPEKTRTKCIEYVKKSQNADGGFRYQISGGSSTFALTAAGLVSLFSANIYSGEEVEKGLKALMHNIPRSGGYNDSYYFYAHYYAVQAAWHAGGEVWRKWYPAIRDSLLKSQSGNGSWSDPQIGAEFGTAMACIILQLPNDYVPIFAW
jgi:hypothetical protein